MILKADSLNIVQDILNGGFVVSLHVEEIPSGAEKLRGEVLSVSMTKWRERRTLTANAYYWVLVSKISEATALTNAAVHNLLLRRYGVPETIDGQITTVMIPDEAEEEILQKELYHLKPTSHTKTGKDGRVFRAYILMKGSSSLDTKEMSRLIAGTTDECKEMGIETLPREEIERMMESYEKHHSNR